MLHIATHNGVFHADEVTAIALLKVFIESELQVTRVPHNQQNFDSFDMVIDIGKRLDKKRYFDHHQYKGGKSSAGLIWEYIGLEKEYKDISKLVKIIDEQDTGVKKAQPFEYPNLIKCFNQSDIYSQKQEEAFFQAVEFAVVTFSSLKRVAQERKKAKEIVKNSFMFEGSTTVLELAEFTPHWQAYVEENIPHIKAVVWEDEVQQKYKIKTTSKHIILPQSKKMEFVHSAGFFGVAKSREDMLQYVRCL